MKLIKSMLFVVVGLTFAGSKYSLVETKTSFFAGGLVEDIDAKSDKLRGIILPEEGRFSFRVMIRSFDFPNDLMEEHFNENYMDSENFPMGTFKGSFAPTLNLEKKGRWEVDVTGILEIRGVKQERVIKAVIVHTDSITSIQSKFKVKLIDHGIEIPSIMMMKIAEVIEVSVEADLELLVNKKKVSSDSKK
jgi:hypothetical protein